MTASKIVVLSYNPERYLEVNSTQTNISDQDDSRFSSQSPMPRNRRTLATELRAYSGLHLVSRDDKSSSPFSRAQLRSQTPPSSVEHQEAATSDGVNSRSNSPPNEITSSPAVIEKSRHSNFTTVRHAFRPEGTPEAKEGSPDHMHDDTTPVKQFTTSSEALGHINDYVFTKNLDDSEAFATDMSWFHGVKTVSERLNFLKEAHKAILQARRSRSVSSSLKSESPTAAEALREHSVSNEEHESQTSEKEMLLPPKNFRSSPNEDSDGASGSNTDHIMTSVKMSQLDSYSSY